MDIITLYLYIRELSEKITGSQLQKIFQSEESGDGEFIFRFRMPGENYMLFTSLRAGEERIHPIPYKFFQGVTPSSFCMALRKHLEGARVTQVNQYNLDRIVHIHFIRSDEEKIMVIELTGKSSNLLILDSQYRYITAFNRRDPSRNILVGQKYQPPQPPTGMNPLSTDSIEFASILKASWEKQEDLKLRNLLTSSFTGLTAEYVREIIYNSCIDIETEVKNLTESEINKLVNSWNDFMGRILGNELDPTIYYGKDDPDMEKRPVRWAPWRFETLKGFPCEVLPKVGDALQALLFSETETRSKEDLKKELTNLVKRKIKKVQQKIEKQKKDLEGTEKANILKHMGDLLLASHHRYPEKMSRIEVDDYYKDPPEKISIELNPSLTVSDNAQEFYRKFKKAKRGQEIIKERLEMSGDELNYLEEMLYEIEIAENESDLEEIAHSLESEGVYRVQLGGGAGKEDEKSGPRKFVLDGGFIALVGRNSRQNEEISVRIAQKDDLWFHARQIPGSHVVVRIQKPSLPVPDKVIHKAAQLAAFFSKARTNSKVSVDYTRIKNVRKVKGQKVGQVFYTNEKTIIVKPELVV
jgi:predicted ribosome quality control (RQC) complex YloA/Tae2 family protein